MAGRREGKDKEKGRKGQREGTERAGQGKNEEEAIRQQKMEALQKARKQLLTDAQEERRKQGCLG